MGMDGERFKEMAEKIVYQEHMEGAWRKICEERPFIGDYLEDIKFKIASVLSENKELRTRNAELEKKISFWQLAREETVKSNVELQNRPSTLLKAAEGMAGIIAEYDDEQDSLEDVLNLRSRARQALADFRAVKENV